MSTKTVPLTEQQMKDINGGDGIVAYDPVTGEPFPEENGGYPPADPKNKDGEMDKDIFGSSF